MLSLNYMKFSNLNNLSLVKLLFKIIFFVAVIFNVNAAEIDLKKILPMDSKILLTENLITELPIT
jgi:hypothetical protein